MITYSQIQNIASDLEFAATVMAVPKNPDEDHWWYECAAERNPLAQQLKLAAEILNHLTIEQVEALPSYLRAA